MDSFSATNQILENLKVKYKHVDNIMNLTKDMERAMIANDSVSFGHILEMRGDLMIVVDELDQTNAKIISRLPEPLKGRMSAVLIPKGKGASQETLMLDNPLETNIYDTNKRIITLLSKIIKLDTEISEKVKGKPQRPPRLMNTRG